MFVPQHSSSKMHAEAFVCTACHAAASIIVCVWFVYVLAYLDTAVYLHMPVLVITIHVAAMAQRFECVAAL
jgi:TctA family transporter